ncbi:transcriptional regulator VspR [Shewanella sairae]|uniref:Transcriptional regulator VspR n=1 Tax=Shewanella sairae TaxID=190310 RepID=A0ABQ4PR68_9GAMM|nr:response regulator [Shewanella sairae]MCL1131652.1 response regulator [Shewanella sairae]GIU51951.1 transcriptional regulator VspR [Shewanella sairae]
MSNPSIKMNAQLNDILQDENFDNFHVTQLRDAYLASSSVAQDFIEARKYVYRQILRLVKKGVLLKNGTKNSKGVTYQKSELFFKANFIIQSKSKPLGLMTTNTSFGVQRLEERLKETEIDLLTSIGESEEYMRLYESFPEMKIHLESMYLQARENSTKLLGQIKAIKSVLAYQLK